MLLKISTLSNRFFTNCILEPQRSHLSTSSSSLALPNRVLLTESSALTKIVAFQQFAAMSSSGDSTRFLAEYAKSGRSSCKKCSEGIAAKTLRLGVVTKDKSRGFDMTRWFHLNCFKDGSEKISSVEKITGFDSLQSDDQEALKALVTEGDEANMIEEVGKEDNLKKRKRTNTESKKEPKVSSDELKMPKRIAEVEVKFDISNVKDMYKDAVLLPKWKAFQTVIFLEKDEGLHGSSKIAAFDFDGCLAKTSVKRSGADAWSLMYPSIPDKLQSLYNDGYKLVIFTNESNIDRWVKSRQKAVDSKIGRINSFIDCVKVPMQVFIACGLGKTRDGVVDAFRKPKPGMWHIMEQHFNSGIPIDMNQSFYVGDAAGRKDDHSDADIKFAEAIALKFYVPEDYFSP